MKDLKPFLLYPNSRVLHEESPHIIIGIDFVNESLMLRNPVTRTRHIARARYTKLILSRLSSITAEHKRELAELMGWQYLDFVTLGNGEQYLEYGNGPHWNFKDYMGLFQYKAADYLRENNYDIDSLIEQGKAIEQPQ